MSKIAKALEKARGGLPGNHPYAAQSAASQIRPVEKEEPPFTYTRTKIIQADFELLDRNRIIYNGSHPMVEIYNLLRAQLIKKMESRNIHTIMITSINRGEGKTLSSINLGLSLAREKQRSSLVVDVNLRNPRLTEYFGIKTENGFADHVRNNISLEKLLINPGIDRFVLLPPGKTEQDTAELLASPKVPQLVQEMRNRYKNRFVLFDCPQLLNMPDALIFSNYVDGVIMVVEEGRNSREEIRKSLDLFEEGKVIGVIMNKLKD